MMSVCLPGVMSIIYIDHIRTSLVPLGTHTLTNFDVFIKTSIIVVHLVTLAFLQTLSLIALSCNLPSASFSLQELTAELVLQPHPFPLQLSFVLYPSHPCTIPAFRPPGWMLHSRPLVLCFLFNHIFFFLGVTSPAQRRANLYFNMPIQTSLWHAKLSDTSPTMHMVVAGLFPI